MPTPRAVANWLNNSQTVASVDAPHIILAVGDGHFGGQTVLDTVDAVVILEIDLTSALVYQAFRLIVEQKEGGEDPSTKSVPICQDCPRKS